MCEGDTLRLCKQGLIGEGEKLRLLDLGRINTDISFLSIFYIFCLFFTRGQYSSEISEKFYNYHTFGTFSGVFSKPCQTSMMERFAKLVNGFFSR